MPFYRQSSATRMQNIPQFRNDSAHQRRLQKPSTPQVWNETGILASHPPMPKHKTVVNFPLLHQWCSIVSERSAGKNWITQGPVHRFVPLINLLVPTWHKSPFDINFIYIYIYIYIYINRCPVGVTYLYRVLNYRALNKSIGSQIKKNNLSRS